MWQRWKRRAEGTFQSAAERSGGMEPEGGTADIAARSEAQGATQNPWKSNNQLVFS